MWAQVLTPQFLILLEVEVVQAGWDLRDTITRVEFHHSLLLIIINIVHLSSRKSKGVPCGKFEGPKYFTSSCLEGKNIRDKATSGNRRLSDDMSKIFNCVKLTNELEHAPEARMSP